MLLRIRWWLRHEGPAYLSAVAWIIIVTIPGAVAERVIRLREAWHRLRYGPVVDDDDERYAGEAGWRG